MGSCPRFIYGNTAQIAYRESHSKFVCTPAAFWRTRSTETVKISTIARHTKSGYPVRHWVAPRKGETRDKAQDYRDECERVEVERRFSLAKRKCGMGLVTAKLRETAAHVIAMSVLVLNLRKIQCAILQLLASLRAILSPKQKWAIVQWTLCISLWIYW